MTDSASELLESVYTCLGFSEGVLLRASSTPRPDEPSNWIEVGQWLRLAVEVGAERVFFVDNNPVAVFAQSAEQDPNQLRKIVNRIWCMARPQLLFLARPGELLVYDLAKPPERESERPLDRCLARARSVSEVQSELASFRREQIESGKLFEEARFETSVNRADQALVRDLRIVRSRLVDAGLNTPHAHALIGRSIFVRYLEDRGILSPHYFESIARDHPRWRSLLTAHSKHDVDPEMDALLFPRVLSDKDFTYALFKKLAADFNGDMFPQDASEQGAVDEIHLAQLQSLLRGDVSAQGSLFFFAYRFDVIPIELISSIYEEFYNTSVGLDANLGCHYTPSALVEFLLSKALTEEMLAKNPRILDPACGSGIFLVEAYRRIVRFKTARLGRRLSSRELRNILRDQLVGIEINPEATRVAAFSLYLALLHYQEPPDILQQKELPNLLYSPGRIRAAERHFDVLLTSNAFDVEGVVSEPETRARFGSACADVVVGNPPWGYPKDSEGKREAAQVLAWCDQRGKPVGDNELSQAFIHRAIDSLRECGRAAMLVSTGVLLKGHDNSRAFRAVWLDAVRLLHVVNFTHVRDVFFSSRKRTTKAIAPFASIVFDLKQQADAPDTVFEYWSAKKTAFTELLQVAVLSRVDLRILRQESVRRNDLLWKIYWWGSHRDEALIAGLSMNPPLKDARFGKRRIVPSGGVGRGFEVVGGPHPVSREMSKYKEFPTKDIERYGPLDLRKLIALPKQLYREGNLEIYNGSRILLRRGISQEVEAGVLIARLESEPFAVRNSVHGVRLGAVPGWVGKILLGILWSSLARYYFFLTGRGWGTWHYEIHKDELERFPIRLPNERRVRDEIVEIVDSLRSHELRQSLHLPLMEDEGAFSFQPSSSSRRSGKAKRVPNRPKRDRKIPVDPAIKILESRLNSAIFDLYELTGSERDLVVDMCNNGLELFYNGMRSVALSRIPDSPSISSGRLSDLSEGVAAEAWLSGYLSAFLTVWNREIRPGQFRWYLVRPPQYSAMIAVIFSAEFDAKVDAEPLVPQTSWADVLRRLHHDGLSPYGTRSVQLEGIFRIVTDGEIVIIKQNERRLWTRSAAREDAEAVMLDVMRRQEAAE